jgi:hypothetical protein
MRSGMGRMEIPLTLWVFFLPTWLWIEIWIVLRTSCPWRLWMPLKRTFFGKLRLHG